MVLDGPAFKATVRLDSFTKERQGEIMYLKVESVTLQNELGARKENLEAVSSIATF